MSGSSARLNAPPIRKTYQMALKLTLAAAAAVLAKVLPKLLFNRTLYRVTGSKLILLSSIALMLALSWWLQGSFL